MRVFTCREQSVYFPICIMSAQYQSYCQEETFHIHHQHRKLKLYCEKHIKLEILNHFLFALLDKLKIFLSPDYLGGYPQPPTLG